MLVDIDSKTVEGPPLLYFYSKGGNLLAIDPNSSDTILAVGEEVVGAEREDHHLFKGPKVPVDVGLVAF